MCGARLDITDAEVRKVHPDIGKLTLKHADNKSLDMPAMTLVFQGLDHAMLDKLQPSTRIEFKGVSRDNAKSHISDKLDESLPTR